MVISWQRSFSEARAVHVQCLAHHRISTGIPSNVQCHDQSASHSCGFPKRKIKNSARVAGYASAARAEGSEREGFERAAEGHAEGSSSFFIPVLCINARPSDHFLHLHSAPQFIFVLFASVLSQYLDA
jgi:hypothetical protein